MARGGADAVADMLTEAKAVSAAAADPPDVGQAKAAAAADAPDVTHIIFRCVPTFAKVSPLQVCCLYYCRCFVVIIYTYKSIFIWNAIVMPFRAVSCNVLSLPIPPRSWGLNSPLIFQAPSHSFSNPNFASLLFRFSCLTPPPTARSSGATWRWASMHAGASFQAMRALL